MDNSTDEKTIRLARMIMDEWPKVGDCLVLMSSRGSHDLYIRYSRMGRPLLIYKRNNYHLVFDNGIGYNTICRICKVLAEIGILNKDYVKIREFRGDLTLRVGPSILLSGNKPCPVEVTLLRNDKTKKRDGWISYYLRCLGFTRNLFAADGYTENKPYKGEDRTDNRTKKQTVKPFLDGH